MAARIEVRPSLDGQFYWALVGGNNQDVCVSETFTRKADAKRAARRAMRLMGILSAENWWGLDAIKVVQP